MQELPEGLSWCETRRRRSPDRDSGATSGALLGLGESPADEERLTAWMLGRLEITVWTPRAQPDVERIAAMLVERWRPAFPADAGPTPWSEIIARARAGAADS